MKHLDGCAISVPQIGGTATAAALIARDDGTIAAVPPGFSVDVDAGKITLESARIYLEILTSPHGSTLGALCQGSPATTYRDVSHAAGELIAAGYLTHSEGVLRAVTA